MADFRRFKTPWRAFAFAPFFIIHGPLCANSVQWWSAAQAAAGGLLPDSYSEVTQKLLKKLFSNFWVTWSVTFPWNCTSSAALYGWRVVLHQFLHRASQAACWSNLAAWSVQQHPSFTLEAAIAELKLELSSKIELQDFFSLQLHLWFSGLSYH